MEYIGYFLIIIGGLVTIIGAVVLLGLLLAYILSVGIDGAEPKKKK